MEQQNDADISMEIDRQSEEQEFSSIDNLIAAQSVEPSNASRTGQEVPLSSTANPSSTVDEDTVGVQNHQKNEWVYIEPGIYFFKLQARTESDALGKELRIVLEQISKIFSENEPFWYHATSRENAEEIIGIGPELSNGKHDFLDFPAFYLNLDCRDAFEWRLKNKEKFQSEHAILIYQFELEDLSVKGKELDKKQHIAWMKNRSKDFPRKRLDYILTYQTSNPKSKQPKIRRTSEGHDAKQLIVCRERMCRHIHKNLIACVFYDELNHIS